MSISYREVLSASFCIPSQTGCHGNVDNHKILIASYEVCKKKIDIAGRILIEKYFNSCSTSQVSFSVASSDLVIINIY